MFFSYRQVGGTITFWSIHDFAYGRLRILTFGRCDWTLYLGYAVSMQKYIAPFTSPVTSLNVLQPFVLRRFCVWYFLAWILGALYHPL